MAFWYVKKCPSVFQMVSYNMLHSGPCVDPNPVDKRNTNSVMADSSDTVWGYSKKKINSVKTSSSPSMASLLGDNRNCDPPSLCNPPELGRVRGLTARQ